MSFILSKERDDDCRAAFERYEAYVDAEKHRFPSEAYALVTSDWYFGFSDHRAPHDAWLEACTISEARSDSEHPVSSISISLKLLGAYHDGHIGFHYEGVTAYSLSSDNLSRGHGDWRYDEFRVSESGTLIHEIEWWGAEGPVTWLIEAADVRHSWHPFHQDPSSTTSQPEPA